MESLSELKCIHYIMENFMRRAMSEGKFDTSHLPYEVWEVGKAAEAYKYQHKKGADCFKILFDWRNL